MKSLKGKEVIVFDMDDTLTPSKSKADKEMAGLLFRLIAVKRVAIIGGAKFALFKEQILDELPQRDPRLAQLSLFPTTACAFYRYENGWKNVYNKPLSAKEKAKIRKELNAVVKELEYPFPKKIYGETLEDRETQMSFSPLGQNIAAVLGKKGIALKEQWRKEHNALRLKAVKLLSKRLPGLEVHAGGITTIDITRKGIDKGYGVRQIEKYLHVPVKKMVFIGDALFPGGNDYAAKKTGIQCIAVKSPKDTKKIIKTILN